MFSPTTTSNDRDPLEIKIKNETRRILGKVFFMSTVCDQLKYFSQETNLTFLSFVRDENSSLAKRLTFVKAIILKSLFVIRKKKEKKKRKSYEFVNPSRSERTSRNTYSDIIFFL